MRGFTLIETLVYLALFTLIIGGFGSASYMLFETNDRNQTKAMLQEEKDFLIGKIEWELSGAKTVTAPASGIPGPRLMFFKSDGSFVVITSSSTDLTMDDAVLNNANTAVT